MPALRATLKIILTIVWLAACFLLALTVTALRGRKAKHGVIRLFYRGTLRLWGVRVRQCGEFLANGPLLIISNHTSYLDILVLGALSPMVFTPKSEIAHWPVIGSLCRFCDVVFIERKASRAVAYQKILREQLLAGEKLSLFPEGTTGEGLVLLPFKSSFFSIAEEAVNGRPIPIQPVVIAYRNVNGIPIAPENRQEVAWVGDADFFPHLWHALGLRRLEVAVECLAPVYFTEFGDRKALAAACRERMGETLARMLAA